MEKDQEDLLTETDNDLIVIRRQQLIPWWIKVFSFLFLVLGAIAPIGFVCGIAGYNFQMALYGASTNQPLSLVGIVITLLFIFKGITAFCLLKEKDIGVKFASIDAAAGIIICLFMMFLPLIYQQSGMAFTFRLELILLVPYLIKMLKIRAAWENTISIAPDKT